MKHCAKYHAGMLKEPVAFERMTRTAAGKGGYSETWAAVANSPTRAHVKALNGAERYASDRVEATARYRLAVRYFSGLQEGDRVRFRSRTHNIRFINNLEFSDQWLEIDVDGGVAQ
jgi:SPP1 family predicted phage head-tail adaptor